MGYIGNSLQQQLVQSATDFFSGNGSTTTFTLTRTPQSVYGIEVVVNNVQQKPDGSSYSVVGNILTFTAAPSSGSNNIYVIYNPVVTSAGLPGYGTVGNNQLGSITNINSIASNLTFQTNGTTALTIDQSQTPTFNSTGAMIIPTGTTAQRPATPSNGMLRKNTTNGYLEYWDPTSSSWIGIGAFAATGGATATYTSGPTTYKVHTFLSSDTLTVLSGSKLIDYMVIGGGGGGGTLGGGGGAGGYLSGTTTLSPGTYSIIIGGGATGGAQGVPGGTGGNTTAFSLTAFGGGGGGSHLGGGTSVSGTSGGSGGGASDNNNSYSYGSGTAGQGNRGGNGSAVFSNIPRGGGGGGGSAGVGLDVGAGGTGGPGTLNAINGTSYYWAGGGGYGGYASGSRGGDGGIGGGGGGSAANGASPAGAGGGSALNNGTAGTVGDNVIGGLGGQNTGGGGGGAGWSYNATGTRSGGSGIVIIRYTV